MLPLKPESMAWDQKLAYTLEFYLENYRENFQINN